MHLVLRVFTTAQALVKAANRVFRPHGLTTPQFNVLNILSRNPAGLRASDLASALIVDPSNVTGLLKRMKKEGLLAELSNGGDGRQYIVGLSAKGRAIWRRANLDYEKCLAALIAPISSAEIATTERVLESMSGGSASLP
jgi:DNA-binding MarR family transcriptional regulator